jgi:branched-chain amino acid aminotransferase
MIEPAGLDNLDFRFRPTDWIYRSFGDADRVPVWHKAGYTAFQEISLSPAAAVLSYGFGVFEGLKAEEGTDGRVRLFRPADHAARFSRSAVRLGMPAFPESRFVEAVGGLVSRNARFVPAAGQGTFYVRPMMHALEPMLGHARMRRFAVTISGSPVGSYFPGEKGIALKVIPVARAAPGGTGAAKAIGNYAGTAAWRAAAHAEGFDDVLFLDAAGQGLVSETSGSNLFCVLRGGEIVTPPLDDTILAGITRESVIRIAREIEGLDVIERPLPIDEVLGRGEEVFCTGTGWGVMPIRTIARGGTTREYREPDVAGRLREALRGIRTGERPDPFGWTREVET